MKMKKTILFFICAASLCTLVLLDACTKREHDTSNPPHNPFEDIHRDDTTSYGIPLDSLTVTYVHKKVFSTRCALPGCHDGHFEPDFRTPQSSFSNLVYADIIKNNTAAEFKYRVIPFDTTHSVLYERITNCCFVTQDDRMPQDNIGVPLPDSSINLIASWIMHGARDMFGNVAHLPNKEPELAYFIAVDTFQLFPLALPTVQYDTIRAGDGQAYNPFYVPINKSVFYVAVPVTDDSTAPANMLVNKLKISTDENNFTGASQYTGTYYSFGGFQAWVVTVPLGSLPANDTLFMRYYVNDGDHVNNTEFPRTELPFPYKHYWSFIRH